MKMLNSLLKVELLVNLSKRIYFKDYPIHSWIYEKWFFLFTWKDFIYMKRRAYLIYKNQIKPFFIWKLSKQWSDRGQKFGEIIIFMLKVKWLKNGIIIIFLWRIHLTLNWIMTHEFWIHKTEFMSMRSPLWSMAARRI